MDLWKVKSRKKTGFNSKWKILIMRPVQIWNGPLKGSVFPITGDEKTQPEQSTWQECYKTNWIPNENPLDSPCTMCLGP